MATNNSKPVADLRIGAVKATIWENEVGGITRNNVTFLRLYRDEGQWKTTHSFGFKNLLTLAKLADQAHTLIAERNAEVASDDEAAKALCITRWLHASLTPLPCLHCPNVVSPQHDISGHHKSRSSGVSSEPVRTSCGRDSPPPRRRTKRRGRHPHNALSPAFVRTAPPGHHIDGDGLLARRGPREGRRQPQSRPRGWRPTRRQAPRPGHPHLRRGDRHGGAVRSIVKII